MVALVCSALVVVLVLATGSILTCQPSATAPILHLAPAFACPAVSSPSPRPPSHAHSLPHAPLLRANEETHHRVGGARTRPGSRGKSFLIWQSQDRKTPHLHHEACSRQVTGRAARCCDLGARRSGGGGIEEYHIVARRVAELNGVFLLELPSGSRSRDCACAASAQAKREPRSCPRGQRRAKHLVMIAWAAGGGETS